ncbi:MAG: hypothetical protein EBE86_033580 [Hormoscilla sp. GUM202]|nr:hypothetical protein [Hormoscilla sp. GUM202]
MNQEEQHLRISSRNEFLHSLDQLQETLLTGEIETPKSPTLKSRGRTGDRLPQKAAPAPMDAGDLEAAVADIEEFINSRHSESGHEDF